MNCEERLIPLDQRVRVHDQNTPDVGSEELGLGNGVQEGTHLVQGEGLGLRVWGLGHTAGFWVSV